MRFQVGQGILGKITFKDGQEPEYRRTYLIVEVDDEGISVLNVSSLEGKEWKLAYKTNMKLEHYAPPFVKPSFVKLDSLVKVSFEDCGDIRLLSGGRQLEAEEMERILGRLG